MAKGDLNIHAIMLPHWRGALPILHAILNGNHETGITRSSQNSECLIYLWQHWQHYNYLKAISSSCMWLLNIKPS